MHVQFAQQIDTAAATAANSRGVFTVAAAHELRVGACGWFDSSYELNRGLVVNEGVPMDEAALALWFPAASQFQ